MNYVTVSEAAKRKGVTRCTVHRWLKNGLPYSWELGRRVVQADVLDAWKPRKSGNPNWKAKSK